MGHSLQGLKEGRCWGRGMLLLFLVSSPTSCSSLGRWQWGVGAGGHISPPQGPATRHGVQGSAQPHGSLCHPLLPWTLLAIPSLDPQCWFSPTAPCLSCAPVLPALHLSQGLLPSLLPIRNKSPSKASLVSQRKQPPTLSPLSHGSWLPPGCCEAFPRAQEVCSGKLLGLSGLTETDVLSSSLCHSKLPP